MNPRCDRCNFYVEVDEEDGLFFGECHRYPPQPVPPHLVDHGWGANSYWAAACAYEGPVVMEDGWCGEFKARRTKTEAN